MNLNSKPWTERGVYAAESCAAQRPSGRAGASGAFCGVNGALRTGGAACHRNPA